jgi:hypothetical protein
MPKPAPKQGRYIPHDVSVCCPYSRVRFKFPASWCMLDTMKPKVRHITMVALCFLVTLLLCCNISISSDLQEKQQRVYSDLKELCDSIPVPEGVEKADSQEVIKPEGGIFTNNFDTDLTCDAARRPFYEYVIKNGWQPTDQHLGYYYRDNYLFHTTCRRGAIFSGRKTRIQVSCSWDASGKDKEFY